VSRSQQYPRPRCPRCRKDRLGFPRHVYEYVVVSKSASSAVLECTLCHYRWRSRNLMVQSSQSATAEMDGPNPH